MRRIQQVAANHRKFERVRHGHVAVLIPHAAQIGSYGLKDELSDDYSTGRLEADYLGQTVAIDSEGRANNATRAGTIACTCRVRFASLAWLYDLATCSLLMRSRQLWLDRPRSEYQPRTRTEVGLPVQICHIYHVPSHGISERR